MSEIEGTIHVTRLSKEGEREPWAYNVAFAPNAGGSGALPVRQVHGDGELRKLLRDGVGVLPKYLDETVKDARAGHAILPRVRLTPEQKRVLRL